MKPPRTLHLALIGFGAIGQSLAQQLLPASAILLRQVIVPEQAVAATAALCARLAPQARVRTQLDLDERLDLVAECAGHAAVRAHVLPALRAGVRCVLASVGALHDEALRAALEAAAREGGTSAQLIAGAMGGMDALAAARTAGLSQVTYVGRKPPLSWQGTPAEQACDLSTLRTAQVIFRGSAREAAQHYPKNANVAATVSLAGLGLDATQVELVADPGVQRNLHTVIAEGRFGRFEIRLDNLPLADNPKTSALTVFSLLRAVRNTVEPLVI